MMKSIWNVPTGMQIYLCYWKQFFKISFTSLLFNFRCWSQFYSCCVQYHNTGLRPLGILLLPYVSGAILLKKSTYSFLRPLDLLEYLYLCPKYVEREHVILCQQIPESKYISTIIQRKIE